MTEELPLPQRILDAAEEVLRRHGAVKANVVDIARVLGMSHANIYRHFVSKKALLDAVAARWLHAVSAPLEGIAADRSQPAAGRLEAWFDALRGAKRRKYLDDPELFRVYQVVTENSHDLVGAHVADLLGQVERIIADGVATREFGAGVDAPTAARAFLRATASFHHPAMVVQEPPASEAEARAVLRVLLAGLRAGEPTAVYFPSASPFFRL